MFDDPRLIPAHAGKTRTERPILIAATAHPRSRGENEGRASPRTEARGSSPLTRGRPGGAGLPIHSPGLIPAHAGKTTIRVRSRRPPRGSSPLTRGKQSCAGCVACNQGLVPAHAGKTRHMRSTRVISATHPRSRGENDQSSRRRGRSCGSSPLTRGKRLSSSVAIERMGLIPAHAGKTHQWRICATRSRAHPRSRGENLRIPTFDLPDRGSSPLTRGKRALFGVPFGGVGLIPAHAGKTMIPSMVVPRWAAHPRSRGENRRVTVGHVNRFGSSPLTRGKLGTTNARALTGGLIPAHAGKTR